MSVHRADELLTLWRRSPWRWLMLFFVWSQERGVKGNWVPDVHLEASKLSDAGKYGFFKEDYKWLVSPSKSRFRKLIFVCENVSK